MPHTNNTLILPPVVFNAHANVKTSTGVANRDPTYPQTACISTRIDPSPQEHKPVAPCHVYEVYVRMTNRYSVIEYLETTAP